jgi:hypothetical protein
VPGDDQNAPRNGRTGENEDVDRFIDQARWLLEYHDRRGESLYTRALGLLGFVGVTLALILNVNPPEGLTITKCLVLLYDATVLTLLATVACCIATFTSRRLKAPGARQLRENWQGWVKDERREWSAVDVAESFLGAKDLKSDSPLELAIAAADDRAAWFKRAVVCMGLSLTLLTVVLIVVGVQIYP